MEDKVIRKFETQGMQLVAQAQAIQITDCASREFAAEFSANTRKAIKLIQEEFRPDIDTAHQLHKGLLDRMKRLIQPFDDAKGVVDGEIQRDFLERERKRKEEEREAWVRVEAERKRQEASRLRDAEDAIARGDMEEAETLLDSEVIVAPVVPIAPLEQTTRSDAGSITARKDIKITVVDKLLVVKSAAEGRLPLTLLDVNEGAAKKYAKAGGFMTLPGFMITETAVVAGRIR